MKVFGNLHHHGLIVDDISRSMEVLGNELGVEWAPIRRFDPLRVWLPDMGWSEAHLTVTYSRQGPIHYELIEMIPGGAYEALRAVSPAHVGAWVADVGAEVEALLTDGWRVIAAGASPKHRYGQMAYMARDGGPVLEVVGEPIRPMIEEWIAS
ncbi:VOC family protein [Novosphingobium kaempferiae]|uniref:VOC family protein n=1 Tax=Novosphingobium kaempferiae TaxID=2896849 RepID=UPI001E623200|nr:VOC family protein [Novosphingobium kaempferiae]